MTVPVKLSRMAKCHLASGVLFSLALCAYLLAGSYRTSLIEIRSGVASMRSNAALMASDTEGIEKRQAQVRKALPFGYASSSPRELMLLSVEKLKTGINGVTMTLDEFSETGETLTLPVVMEFDTDSFEEGVKGIEAIRSLKMPYFEFRNIDIRRLEGSYSSARYKVEGVMTMPAQKIAAPSEAEKKS
ncbi:MAG: hypothetical protein IT362_09595 [Deltaproteobacteria bacterium]|nr:hypothetical protein [Deltaproteobacteria bacterium]